MEKEHTPSRSRSPEVLHLDRETELSTGPQPFNIPYNHLQQPYLTFHHEFGIIDPVLITSEDMTNAAQSSCPPAITQNVVTMASQAQPTAVWTLVQGVLPPVPIESEWQPEWQMNYLCWPTTVPTMVPVSAQTSAPVFPDSSLSYFPTNHPRPGLPNPLLQKDESTLKVKTTQEETMSTAKDERDFGEVRNTLPTDNQKKTLDTYFL